MRSRGQVIHIAEDTHAALKAYCAEQGHDMSAFVAGLIVGEVTRLRDEKQRRQPLVFVRPEEG